MINIINIYQSIANAVIAKLKQYYHDTDVYMEEILVAGGNEDNSANSSTADNDNYFFIDLIPLATVILGEYDCQLTVMIDIAAYLSSESNKDYLQMADNLNSIFCPVLCFEDRAITLQDVQSQVVDKVLHYKFTLKFEVAQGNAPDFDNMGELVLNEEV